MQGGALILAAGFSRRFGSDKRWYELTSGEALLISTIKLYLDTVHETRVVLRKDDRQLATHIQQYFKGARTPELLFSANSHLGMGHSIADSMHQVKSWKYIIMALGDMPRIQPDTIKSIEQELQQALQNNCPKIVRPVCRGQQPGHPVGFTHEFFAELATLGGDHGAKQVIDRHTNSLVLLNCDDDGILWDIDKSPE